jgi:hypothetical protein
MRKIGTAVEVMLRLSLGLVVPVVVDFTIAPLGYAAPNDISFQILVAIIKYSLSLAAGWWILIWPLKRYRAGLTTLYVPTAFVSMLYIELLWAGRVYHQSP